MAGEPSMAGVPVCTCGPRDARFQVFGNWAEQCYTCGRYHPLVARWMKMQTAAVVAGNPTIPHPYTWAVTCERKRLDGAVFEEPVWTPADVKRYMASARKRRNITK